MGLQQPIPYNALGDMITSYYTTDGGTKQIPFFMIGQGPTFADFEKAKEKCNPFYENVINVSLGPTTFDPPELFVPVGTGVCFDNADNKTHRIAVKPFGSTSPVAYIPIELSPKSSSNEQKICPQQLANLAIGAYVATDASNNDTALINVTERTEDSQFYVGARITPEYGVVTLGKNAVFNLADRNEHNLTMIFGGNLETEFVLNLDNRAKNVSSTQLGEHEVKDSSTNKTATIFVSSATNVFSFSDDNVTPSYIARPYGDSICFASDKDIAINVYRSSEGDWKASNLGKKVTPGSICCLENPLPGRYYVNSSDTPAVAYFYVGPKKPTATLIVQAIGFMPPKSTATPIAKVCFINPAAKKRTTVTNGGTIWNRAIGVQPLSTDCTLKLDEDGVYTTTFSPDLNVSTVTVVKTSKTEYIQVLAFGFDKLFLQVKAGDKVCWVNADEAVHKLVDQNNMPIELAIGQSYCIESTGERALYMLRHDASNATSVVSSSKDFVLTMSGVGLVPQSLIAETNKTIYFINKFNTTVNLKSKIDLHISAFGVALLSSTSVAPVDLRIDNTDNVSHTIKIDGKSYAIDPNKDIVVRVSGVGTHTIQDSVVGEVTPLVIMPIEGGQALTSLAVGDTKTWKLPEAFNGQFELTEDVLNTTASVAVMPPVLGALLPIINETMDLPVQKVSGYISSDILAKMREYADRGLVPTIVPNFRDLEVVIKTSSFEPNYVVATPGSNITWQNLDNMVHVLRFTLYDSESGNVLSAFSQTLDVGKSYTIPNARKNTVYKVSGSGESIVNVTSLDVNFFVGFAKLYPIFAEASSSGIVFNNYAQTAYDLTLTFLAKTGASTTEKVTIAGFDSANKKPGMYLWTGGVDGSEGSLTFASPTLGVGTVHIADGNSTFDVSVGKNGFNASSIKMDGRSKLCIRSTDTNRALNIYKNGKLVSNVVAWSVAPSASEVCNFTYACTSKSGVECSGTLNSTSSYCKYQVTDPKLGCEKKQGTTCVPTRSEFACDYSQDAQSCIFKGSSTAKNVLCSGGCTPRDASVGSILNCGPVGGGCGFSYKTGMEKTSASNVFCDVFKGQNELICTPNPTGKYSEIGCTKRYVSPGVPDLQDCYLTPSLPTSSITTVDNQYCYAAFVNQPYSFQYISSYYWRSCKCSKTCTYAYNSTTRNYENVCTIKCPSGTSGCVEPDNSWNSVCSQYGEGVHDVQYTGGGFGGWHQYGVYNCTRVAQYSTCKSSLASATQCALNKGGSSMPNSAYPITCALLNRSVEVDGCGAQHNESTYTCSYFKKEDKTYPYKCDRPENCPCVQCGLSPAFSGLSNIQCSSFAGECKMTSHWAIDSAGYCTQSEGETCVAKEGYAGVSCGIDAGNCTLTSQEAADFNKSICGRAVNGCEAKYAGFECGYSDGNCTLESASAFCWSPDVGDYTIEDASTKKQLIVEGYDKKAAPLEVNLQKSYIRPATAFTSPGSAACFISGDGAQHVIAVPKAFSSTLSMSVTNNPTCITIPAGTWGISIADPALKDTFAAFAEITSRLDDVIIRVKSRLFDPEMGILRPGSTFTFKNLDSMDHTVGEASTQQQLIRYAADHFTTPEYTAETIYSDRYVYYAWRQYGGEAKDLETTPNYHNQKLTKPIGCAELGPNEVECCRNSSTNLDFSTDWGGNWPNMIWLYTARQSRSSVCYKTVTNESQRSVEITKTITTPLNATETAAVCGDNGNRAKRIEMEFDLPNDVIVSRLAATFKDNGKIALNDHTLIEYLPSTRKCAYLIGNELSGPSSVDIPIAYLNTGSAKNKIVATVCNCKLDSGIDLSLYYESLVPGKGLTNSITIPAGGSYTVPAAFLTSGEHTYVDSKVLRAFRVSVKECSGSDISLIANGISSYEADSYAPPANLACDTGVQTDCKKYNPFGPSTVAIVTTEEGLNMSDPSDASCAMEQLPYLKASCPKCTSALLVGNINLDLLNKTIFRGLGDTGTVETLPEDTLLPYIGVVTLGGTTYTVLNGTFTITGPGAFTLTGGALLKNLTNVIKDGTTKVNGGTVATSGGNYFIIRSGTVNIVDGSSFEITGGEFTTFNGTVPASGKYSISSGAFTTEDTQLRITQGTAAVAEGLLSINGSFSSLSGGKITTGTATVSGGSFTIRGERILITGGLTGGAATIDNAQIRIKDATFVTSAGALDNLDLVAYTALFNDYTGDVCRELCDENAQKSEDTCIANAIEKKEACNKKADDEARAKCIEDVSAKKAACINGIPNGKDACTEGCGTCSVDNIMNEKVALSKLALYNYKKPSILLELGAKEGSNAAGTCNWTNDSIIKAYTDFYDWWVPILAGSGTIGAAQHCYQDKCISMDIYGLLDVKGNDKAWTNAWFKEGCGNYYYKAEGLMPLTFSLKETNYSLCDPSRMFALLQQMRCMLEKGGVDLNTMKEEAAKYT
jgi:plastocyanin